MQKITLILIVHDQQLLHSNINAIEVLNLSGKSCTLGYINSASN